VGGGGKRLTRCPQQTNTAIYDMHVSSSSSSYALTAVHNRQIRQSNPLVGEVNTITIALQANDHAVLRYARVSGSRYKLALCFFFKPRNSTAVTSTASTLDALKDPELTENLNPKT